jgi:Ca-activated chloride channel family protein
MRPCSKPFRLTTIAAALALCAGFNIGPLAVAQSKAPDPQKPLTVDRDPVVSPDPADNLPGPEIQPPSVSTGSGSSNSLSKGDHGYTLRRDVEEVVLNCTVLDDHNKLVMNLTKPDFSVAEDGVAQTIVSFQHEDIPVSMGILVDNSGSMRDKRQAVNSAALDLVKASNKDDEAFVVNFSDEAYIDQDFTSDLGKLREGLAHIDSKGGTALYDAVVASADQLAKGAKRPKQVLLVITDGEDNASVMSLEQTIQRIQALQGPVVYSIGLLFKDEGGGREARRAKRALQILSSETGGVAFFPKSLDEVDEIAAEVARDIRSQYTIGYHSTKPASLGGYRIVKVEAHAQGNLRRNDSGFWESPTSTSPFDHLRRCMCDCRLRESPSGRLTARLKCFVCAQ